MSRVARGCFVVVMVIACIWLGSCDPALTHGYIYDHHIHPASTSIIPGHSTTTCTGRRIRTCTTSFSPPVIIHHPETYEIDISNCTHNVRSSECMTNALYVSKEEYDRYPIGSYYGSSER